MAATTVPSKNRMSRRDKVIAWSAVALFLVLLASAVVVQRHNSRYTCAKGRVELERLAHLVDRFGPEAPLLQSIQRNTEQARAHGCRP